MDASMTPICPSCLAEKPAEVTVSIDYEGDEIRFCRCPGCVEAFGKRPEELLERLTDGVR